MTPIIDFDFSINYTPKHLSGSTFGDVTRIYGPAMYNAVRLDLYSCFKNVGGLFCPMTVLFIDKDIDYSSFHSLN